MTKLLYLSLTVLGLYLAAAPVQGKPSCLSESCAEQLLETMDLKYRESAKNLYENPDTDLSPELVLRDDLLPYIALLQKFDWQPFESPLLRRQFEVLLRELKYPALNANFRRATNTLKSLGKDKFVCDAVPSRRPGPCKRMSFIKDIKPIITNQNNLEEIRYYWKEWRSSLPAAVKDALHYYVQYYQNVSTPELSPSAVWYEQYEAGSVLSDLENVMETIAPLYKQLHAHLRQALRQSYGDAIIPASGLIPHHLMERALFQAWKKESILQNPFPQKKLPNLQQELRGMHLKPFDLVKTGTEFFDSMGFPKFLEEFMRDHFLQIQDHVGGPDCKSYIFTHGEIELDYCPKVNYKKLLTTHGDVAQIEYAIFKNNKGLGLSREACPGFGNALGEATILSASTPKHLQQRLHLLLDYNYDDELNLNFLYRMAVHALLSVPTYFVHEKLWVDMIDQKVAPEDYSCHYWNLMEKYMGVGPSVETDRNTYDMPPKFYEGVVEEFRGTKKLFGEFMGYQIYRDICLKIGQFQPGNAQKTLLQCDLAGNEEAGALLKKVMTPGSTQQWREIIKVLTPTQNNKLEGSAFLDYYAPLQTWITADNAAKNLTVGWQSVDSCKGAH